VQVFYAFFTVPAVAEAGLDHGEQLAGIENILKPVGPLGRGDMSPGDPPVSSRIAVWTTKCFSSR